MAPEPPAPTPHPLIAALARERVRQGITQRQLAKLMGTTQSAISEIEGASELNIKLLTLKRYAGALGVVVHWELEYTRPTGPAISKGWASPRSKHDQT